MKKYLFLFFSIFLFASCGTISLEKKFNLLPNDIKFWINCHYFIMNESKCSKELLKEFGLKKQISEFKLFLGLTERYKIFYIENFWKWHGGDLMKTEWHERLKIGFNAFRDETKNYPFNLDRFFILMTCGFPFDVQRYEVDASIDERVDPFSDPRFPVGSEFIGTEMDNAWHQDKGLVEIWSYWLPIAIHKSSLIKFYFVHRFSGKWELTVNLFGTEQRRFQQIQLKRFFLNIEGWQEILSTFLPDYLENVKKK